MINGKNCHDILIDIEPIKQFLRDHLCFSLRNAPLKFWTLGSLRNIADSLNNNSYYQKIQCMNREFGFAFSQIKVFTHALFFTRDSVPKERNFDSMDIVRREDWRKIRIKIAFLIRALGTLNGLVYIHYFDRKLCQQFWPKMCLDSWLKKISANWYANKTLICGANWSDLIWLIWSGVFQLIWLICRLSIASPWSFTVVF